MTNEHKMQNEKISKSSLLPLSLCSGDVSNKSFIETFILSTHNFLVMLHCQPVSMRRFIK